MTEFVFQTGKIRRNHAQHRAVRFMSQDQEKGLKRKEQIPLLILVEEQCEAPPGLQASRVFYGLIFS